MEETHTKRCGCAKAPTAGLGPPGFKKLCKKYMIILVIIANTCIVFIMCQPLVEALYKMNPTEPHSDPERLVSPFSHFTGKETEVLEC